MVSGQIKTIHWSPKASPAFISSRLKPIWRLENQNLVVWRGVQCLSPTKFSFQDCQIHMKADFKRCSCLPPSCSGFDGPQMRHMHISVALAIGQPWEKGLCSVKWGSMYFSFVSHVRVGKERLLSGCILVFRTEILGSIESKELTSAFVSTVHTVVIWKCSFFNADKLHMVFVNVCESYIPWFLCTKVMPEKHSLHCEFIQNQPRDLLFGSFFLFQCSW